MPPPPPPPPAESRNCHAVRLVRLLSRKRLLEENALRNNLSLPLNHNLVHSIYPPTQRLGVEMKFEYAVSLFSTLEMVAKPLVVYVVSGTISTGHASAADAQRHPAFRRPSDPIIKIRVPGAHQSGPGMPPGRPGTAWRPGPWPSRRSSGAPSLPLVSWK